MILTDNNEVYVWGLNNNGQLGLGDIKNRNTPCKFSFPAEWGRIKEVSFGSAHSIALTDLNEIYSWGANNYGQLGLGDINSFRSTPHFPPLM
jgi:alpha-tubulin suppressor-like RCC1 family protein